MIHEKMTTKKPHHGRNVKRLREVLGVKQETLAISLGVSQQAVSKIEEKEVIDEEMLEQISKALKVPVDTIKNFSEEAAVFNIQNNYDGSTIQSSPVSAYQCNFNPLDKYVEAMEENKKLYEALMKEKEEKIALLERMLKERK